MDEKGEEMHKSKGNAIEFEEGADQMGVDAMRWMYSGTNPASNLLFGFGRADDTRRRMLIPLWKRLLVLHDLRQHRRLHSRHSRASHGRARGTRPLDHLGVE